MTEPPKVLRPDVFARQVDQLSIRDLRVLTMISELGTVSAAAKALEISQPAASYSLEKSRQTFGDQLFENNKKKLIPTEVCQRLISVAETTLHGLGLASLPKSSDPSEISGEVILLRRNNDWRFFDKLTQRFFETAPHGRLQFVATSDQDTDSYLAHQCDLFIGAPGRVEPSVSEYTISDIPCQMAFNPKNVVPPKTAQEFLSHRFAVSWTKSGIPNKGIGVVDQALANFGQPPRLIHYKSPSLASIAQVLHETDLIFTGPVHSLPSGFAGLCHAPLPFETNTLSLSVRWLETRRKNPLVKHVIDLAIDVLEEEYSTGEENFVTVPYEYFLK